MTPTLHKFDLPREIGTPCLMGPKLGRQAQARLRKWVEGIASGSVCVIDVRDICIVDYRFLSISFYPLLDNLQSKGPDTDIAFALLCKDNDAELSIRAAGWREGETDLCPSELARSRIAEMGRHVVVCSEPPPPARATFDYAETREPELRAMLDHLETHEAATLEEIRKHFSWTFEDTGKYLETLRLRRHLIRGSCETATISHDPRYFSIAAIMQKEVLNVVATPPLGVGTCG